MTFAELHAAWDRAWFEKDSEAADRMMAEDCIFIGTNGQFAPRSLLMEIIRSPGYQIIEGSRTEVQIVPLGEEGVVITDHWRGSGTAPDGSVFRDDSRSTFVWARRKGEWKLVLGQATNITA